MRFLSPSQKSQKSHSIYSSSGASTGQTPAQVPHPIHCAGSILYLSSPSVIQPTGHSAAHAPHLIHFSVILYAMSFTTFQSSFFIVFFASFVYAILIDYDLCFSICNYIFIVPLLVNSFYPFFLVFLILVVPLNFLFLLHQLNLLHYF